MSEFAPQPAPQEALRIHDKELAHLGALVMEAAMREDLSSVTEAHVRQTGLENPNNVPSEQSKGFNLASSEISMSSDSVYRQVHAAAVEDLATSGVVRNRGTAEGSNHARWGDQVFWNSGQDGKKTGLGNRLVIEADKPTARSEWVTADKVSAVYARYIDGEVKNIISKNQILINRGEYASIELTPS